MDKYSGVAGTRRNFMAKNSAMLVGCKEKNTVYDSMYCTWFLVDLGKSRDQLPLITD